MKFMNSSRDSSLKLGYMKFSYISVLTLTEKVYPSVLKYLNSNVCFVLFPLLFWGKYKCFCN